jgi:peptidyl-prolyl cis-trans isomerase C
MLKKTLFIALTIVSLFIISGCSEEPGNSAKTEKSTDTTEASVLATVDGEKITLEDYSDRIAKMPSKMRREIVGQEGKEKALDNMIKDELFYKEALKRGYETNSKVVERLETLRRGVILEAFFKDLLNKNIPIGDDEIVLHFKENKETFDRPEMVKVSHILVSDNDTAIKVMAEIKQGNNFKELAKKYSNDKGSSWKGGDLGFIQRGKMPAEFDEAAFALKREAEISDIVKSNLGYHIIKFSERVPFIDSSLNPSVMASIKRKLLRKRQEQIVNDFAEELMTQYNVSTRKDLLETFALPTYRGGGHGGGMGTAGGAGGH